MDQIYWCSTPLEKGTDTRQLIYRYGRFVYAGQVITEPLVGLEFLPAVLQGIQAVQGQIPYLCEFSELPSEIPFFRSLGYIDRAINVIHDQLDKLMPKVEELAANGNSWLESDDVSLYFEFEAAPGYDCHGSDVIFAKTFRNDIMLTVIWYGSSNSFYVTLNPVSDEEQSLVDTLFPSIYGKRRGLCLIDYDTPIYSTQSDDAWIENLALKNNSDSSKYDDSSPFLLSPNGMFTRVSVWESDGHVPSLDELKLQLEAEHARLEALETLASEEEANVVDITFGNGYAQIYAVMKPAPYAPTMPLANGAILTPRSALFRFGSWVYGGQVEFPVDQLLLSDVPFVLPALQKQQGQLAFVSDASSFPLDHPMAPTILQFSDAVALLKQEMVASEDALVELSSTGLSSWIDEDWSAAFFELQFQPSSLRGALPHDADDGYGLIGTEVVAGKFYLQDGGGVILHVVYMNGSLFCVMSEGSDDIPLLDVAFPDVTARNRVVQVKGYDSVEVAEAARNFPNSPAPKCLRVWEGRRRGVVGVGYGAVSALGDSDNKHVMGEIQRKARERAEAEERKRQELVSKNVVKGIQSTELDEAKAVHSPLPVDTKCDDEDSSKNDDIYDMGGLSASLAVASGGGSAMNSIRDRVVHGSVVTNDHHHEKKKSAVPQQLFSSARPSHHLQPLNRLQFKQENELKTDAPWDASGKPK